MMQLHAQKKNQHLEQTVVLYSLTAKFMAPVGVVSDVGTITSLIPPAMDTMVT